MRGLLASLGLAALVAADTAGTSMQQKLSSIKPFPVGVVFIQDPRRHKTLDDIRAEFRTIRATGFTALKQIFLSNLTAANVQAVFNAALDEDLVPWWYGRGGWDAITPELLQKLGIPANTTLEEAEEDPRMRAYQLGVLRQRANIMGAFQPEPPPDPSMPSPPGLSVLPLANRLVPAFADWLRRVYGSIDALREAWHVNVMMVAPGSPGPVPANFSDAAALVAAKPAPTDGWDRLYEASSFAFTPWQQAAGSGDWGRWRDAFAFQAEQRAAVARRKAAFIAAQTPGAPVRVGGETMLMDNQAADGQRRSLQAALAGEFGAFYDSLHFPWHYAITSAPRGASTAASAAPFYRYNFETLLYAMARDIADQGRGVWSGTFESSGGPAQLSGMQPAGVTAATVRQMLMGYAAAGLRGVGMWCWNARFQGQEGGEYALTDLQGKPGPRARAAGAVAQAFQKWRYELWDAADGAAVALLYSWEAEALYARSGFAGGPVIQCAVAGCTDFRAQQPWYPVKARMGAAAALTAAGVPWAWVTEEQLAGWGGEGLWERGFTVLAAPGLLGANASTLVPSLAAFVAKGGRVVADAPFLLYGTGHGDILDQTDPVAPGGPSVADVFGAFTRNLQNTANGHDHTVAGSDGEPLRVAGIWEEVGTAGAAQPRAEPAAWQADQRPFVSRVTLPAPSGGAAVRVTYELFKLAFAEAANATDSPDGVDPGTATGTGRLARHAVDVVTDGLRAVPPLGWRVADGARGGPIVPSDGRILAFRRSAAAAGGGDHHFLISRRSANASLTLELTGRDFPADAHDAVTGEPLGCAGVGTSSMRCPVALAAKDARWVRVPPAAA